jgi:hypothetical protein
VYGILRLLAAVWLVFFQGTATVMFGALLVRVPNPFALMSDFHALYGAWIVLSILCGVLGLLAGAVLLSSKSSARRLPLIAAFLSLSEVPFGTTLGIYTLVVLVPAESGVPRTRL